ncbi:uncharacterized protein PAC_09327 [Phialocephala subalpina]|uniref:KN homeodomain domain-containing protein n=1 Tax=Phialocephala subalpina TaxID=576137 RepID=A0A1L7X311_9HELO|nr:uncharacterized protein PAC_09327 [Phialocephala subalpina]
MPLGTLELGHVLLTNSADKIQLSAISTASLQLPQSIATSNHTNILKALTSGHIWTSRGIGCSLDITILFNSKRLDKTQRLALLESLERRLSDAKIWPQLSLLPSLEINTVHTLESNRPDISIAIKYGPPPPATKAGPRGWLLDKTDVIPPRDVLRADVERIQLQLDFLTIREPEMVEPRVEELHSHNELDLLLLEQVFELPQKDHLLQLENAVRSLKNLSHSIGDKFGSLRTILPNRNIVSSLGESNSTSLIRHKADMYPSILDLSAKESTPRGSKRFPKQVIDILEGWLESNASSPFPTESQKQELMRQTGLKRREQAVHRGEQLNDRLRYSRRKLAATSTESEQEMLFSIPVSEDEPHEDDDPTDLLSQLSDDTPSLLSQPSTTSTKSESLSLVPLIAPLRDEKAPGAPIPLLDISVAGKLLDSALQVLIVGQYPKMRLPPDIQLEKPNLERTLSQTSLSQLAPTMFNPGYRQLMAHNSRFLPTLTHALAISLPKNVQSPTLRKKLEQLAKLPLSPLAPDSKVDASIDPSERISRVVQARLFSMMQRTLYDPSATRKLFKKSTIETTTDIPADDDEDSTPKLLDEQNSKKVDGSQWDEMLAQFTSDDEFDDLLGEEEEDDDFDLLDEGERERLAIERETDEMLLGGGWGEHWEEDDDFLLAGGETGGEGEGMLL